MKEDWANGAFSASFDVEMAVKNAGATGYCNALADLMNIDYQDLEIVNEQ